ncbi:double zinc ribbon [bacterium BMS3Abin04]|nr:double zinc ribbon [bacterium BMS3Abin04]
MSCDGWYLGYGNYWHWGNMVITILIFAVILWLIYRLTANNVSRKTTNGSFLANNFVSINKELKCPNCKAEIETAFIRCPECNYKLKDNCPTCGKIVKTSWSVCPYCETKLK